jgi:hypothetical protein
MTTPALTCSNLNGAVQGLDQDRVQVPPRTGPLACTDRAEAFVVCPIDSHGGLTALAVRPLSQTSVESDLSVVA